MSKFNEGDRAVTNSIISISTGYPVGATGTVTKVVYLDCLYFTPDVPVEGKGNEDGAWAVLSDELDNLEN